MTLDSTAAATPENVAHLFRRAAFVGTPDEIEEGVEQGIEATVDWLFDHRRAEPVLEPKRHVGGIPYEPLELDAWLIGQAVHSPTPAIERLMWFWIGHFPVGLDKVEQSDLLFRFWAVLRRHGLGRFDSLLSHVTHDGAMNIWLDLHGSIAGNPNENFSRELMELFSLGAGNGYTEADVREGARALTGYSVDYDIATGVPLGGRFRPELHDHGTKTFLGRSGRFDADDVLSIVTQRPESHRFIASRVWHRFAGTLMPADVEAVLVSAFARRLRVDDLLQAMLTHPRFYAAGVRHGLVAHPVETMVRTIRGFDLPFLSPGTDPDASNTTERSLELTESLLRMGQVPTSPPNVSGWPHNSSWLDSNRSAARLLVGTEIGTWLDELPVGAELRSVAHRPAHLAAALMQRFGRIRWSPATEAAIGAAAHTESIAAAFAVAFTSPEVVLS